MIVLGKHQLQQLSYIALYDDHCMLRLCISNFFQFFIHLVVPVYNVHTRAAFYHMVMGVYRKLNLTPVFSIFSLVKISNA